MWLSETDLPSTSFTRVCREEVGILERLTSTVMRVTFMPSILPVYKDSKS